MVFKLLSYFELYSNIMINTTIPKNYTTNH